jgi:hypothetical protein
MIANFPYQLCNLAVKQDCQKRRSEREKPPMKGGEALASQPADLSNFFGVLKLSS